MIGEILSGFVLLFLIRGNFFDAKAVSDNCFTLNLLTFVAFLAEKLFPAIFINQSRLHFFFFKSFSETVQEFQFSKPFFLGSESTEWLIIEIMCSWLAVFLLVYSFSNVPFRALCV